MAVALATEGIEPDRRRIMARDLLKECQQAWDFEPFAKLRASATEVIPEWALEDCAGGNVIRVGRVDLVLKTPEAIILVDFKTGSPAGDVETWLKTETDRYRPQLAAYAGMAQKISGQSPLPLRPVLFFTAPPRWVEVH